VGIVGLGRIGHGMARCLEPFGVQIAYAGGRPQDVRWPHVASVVALAAEVDVLIVYCKGGEETHGHLVDAKVLQALEAG
jgi:lactate dehydrogenase-like 2-hydroxyacid dehydrogenase